MKNVLVGLLFMLLITLSACGTHAGNKQAPSLFRIDVDELFPGNLQAQDLAKAAARGDIAKIDKLVAEGADVNTRGVRGVTLPAWVLFHPNKAGFRRLMELGADPNLLWDSGESLLHWAVRMSDEIGTEYFTMAIDIGGGDPNLKSGGRFGEHPIERGLHTCKLKSFAELYSAGAEFDYWASEGTTIVSATAGLSHFRLVYFMLEQGVNYHQKNMLGFGLHSDLQFVLDRNSHFATDPTNKQYMWFWRCIDFLEKRGETFDIPPSIVRPIKLDTTPVNIFSGATGQPYQATRSSNLQGLKLVYPTPMWISPRYAIQDFKHQQQFEDDLTVYKFVAKKDSFEAWNETMSVSAAYAPGTTLDTYATAALGEYIGSCANGSGLQTVEAQSDHRVYYFKCTGSQMSEGYLYVGQYKDTFVSVFQAWRISDTEGDSDRRAKALAGARKIEMKEGFKVVPKNRADITK